MGSNLFFCFFHGVPSVEECTPQGTAADEPAGNNTKSRMGTVLHSFCLSIAKILRSLAVLSGLGVQV